MCAQSCLTLCNPWAVARQAPLSMKFSRQESWSGLPFPPPGDFPDPGIEPLCLLHWQMGSFFTTKPPRKPTFREKAMPKGIGVSGFVEKVIPFPELSIPSFLAVNSQLYSIILFTGLCIPIDNNGGGGQKNSLTSTLPPSQIYFSQVKLDRGQKRKKEKKKTFKTQLIQPRRKGSGLCFLLPRPWQG